MLSDTDAACVAVILASGLKKENNIFCSKEWYKQIQKYIHGIQVAEQTLRATV